MTPWMQDLLAEQAQRAFDEGDLATLRSTIAQLVQFQGDNVQWWNALAEALLQSQLWYEAALWCDAWQQRDQSGIASYFNARIEAQVGLLNAAKQRLQYLPPSLRQTEEVSALAEVIDSEMAQINQSLGGLTIALLIATAVEHRDQQALMLIALRLDASVKLSAAEQRHIGFAFYHSKLYVKALNHLTLATPWDDEISFALVHGLLMIGDCHRAQALLDKQFGKKWPTMPKGRGLGLRIAFMQSDEKACFKYLRDADTATWQEPFFVDACSDWIARSKAPRPLYDFLQAQTSRLAALPHFWSMYALACARCNEPATVYREAYRQAIALQTDDALLWAKLAASLVAENQLELGFQAYQQSLQIDSARADTWQELAMLAAKKGDDAVAQQAFARALGLAPKNGALWSNYGNFLLRQRALQKAVECGRLAVQFEPDSVTCWNNLAAACLNQHYHLEAKNALDKALALDPTFISALSNQARATGQLGEFDTALRLFDALPHKDVKTCSSMLFYANYHPDLSAEAIYAIYRRLVDQHFPRQQFFDYDNELRADRPLVIGYVSPDLRHHPCFHFISPLLQQRDRSQFTVIAYSDVVVADRETTQLKAAVDVWRDVAYCNDEQLAEHIRRDKVDILVDLAGHTNDNRLTLFARKPAPVQVTWLGFGYTTGLRQIDYFLTDEEMFPPGAERVFAEAPARVPVPCFAYQPPDDVPDVADAPCLRNGYVTFGSLSRTVRLNQRLLQTWIQLLQRVPDSHLLLNSFSFAESALRDRYLQFFEQNGITADRLDIGFETPPWPVYERIDIMLDCFPHNSGTTLFEGLYMGVPFVTRRDRVSMGRLGATIARGLGRDEWIANDDASYIAIAAAMASNHQQLAQQRAQLRQQLLHSALGDQKGFCQRVETVYRQIWTQYCDRQRHSSGQTFAEQPERPTNMDSLV